MYTEIMLFFSFVPVVIQQNYSVLRAKRKEQISVCRAEACPRGRKNGTENKKALKTQCFQDFLMAERVGFEVASYRQRMKKEVNSGLIFSRHVNECQ